MIQFSEAGIRLKYLGRPVLLLSSIRVDEGPFLVGIQGPGAGKHPSGWVWPWFCTSPVEFYNVSPGSVGSQ